MITLERKISVLYVDDEENNLFAFKAALEEITKFSQLSLPGKD